MLSRLLLTLSTILSLVRSSSSLRTVSNMSFKRAKLAETASSKVIGTHSGSFQADEAMAVFLLRQLPEYRHSKVVRSRDPAVLEPLDIVVDVGGVYDHALLRYDHHQRGYEERFTPDRCTKLSAAGLVYRHYGEAVVKAYYPELHDQHTSVVYNKLYDRLFEALDAIDTGVEPHPEPLLYKDSTGLASRVGRLNPRWNEEGIDPDERFEQAVQLCGADFEAILTSLVESDLPARQFVEQAVLERHSVDASGEILCLKAGGMPWKNHLYELEQLHSVDPLVKFVLYTDQSGMWRVQAVTVEGTAFENRLGLPEEWRGVRDEDLEAVTQIPGSRFVHAAGFIGGANTFEGALAMAREALKRA